MSAPVVSIIMPCYQMASYIGKAIEGVMAQSFDDWELLIVDDASDDGTPDVVKTYLEKDNRIGLAVKERHSGIADTRNLAINMARGRFLAFHDADDVWHPDKLEKQLAFMEEKQAGISYTAYDWIDTEGNSLNKIIHTAGDLDYDKYLKNTIIGCSSVMVDRNVVGEVDVPSFRTSEDMATWLTILKKGHLAYALELPLMSYRIRPHSASSNKFKAAMDVWSVYRKHERFSVFKPLRYFFSYAFNAIKKRL